MKCGRGEGETTQDSMFSAGHEPTQDSAFGEEHESTQTDPGIGEEGARSPPVHRR